MAVLRTPAGLRREDSLHLHLGAAPGEANLVGQGCERADGGVRQDCEAGEDLGLELTVLVDQGGRRVAQELPDLRSIGGREVPTTIRRPQLYGATVGDTPGSKATDPP